MSIQCIQIDDILIDKSRFSLKNVLYGVDENDADLKRSLQEFGILSPATVFKDASGSLHLVDGFKRIRFARDTGLPATETVVLPASALVEEIIAMILYDKRTIIGESVINKVSFVSFAVSLEVPEEWMLKSLCIPLELKPHKSFMEECERIMKLPHELKSFCHEKKFSLKQIINLSHHPEDLLMQLMSWRSVLQLSAWTLDEMASNLKDYLRSNNIAIRAFVSDAEVEYMINSNLSPRDRTNKLRKLISVRRYPVLSEVNEKIEKAVSSMDLPDEVAVSWDRTLENKGVNINISIKDHDEWDYIRKSINITEIQKAIEAILNEL